MAEVKFDDEAWLRSRNDSLTRTPLESEGVTKFEPHARKIIQRGLAGFGTAPRLSDVPFCFLTNDEVNAFALRSEKHQYRIAFFDGLLFGLLKNLSIAAMHPGMKDWIPEGVSPQDCDILLTFIAYDFLISHELAHIVNGHLALMMDKGLGFMVSEAVGDKRNSLGTMDCQALEFDADVTAAVIGFKYLMNLHRQIREPAVSEEERTHYIYTLLNEGTVGIRLFFFAIARLFLLLGPDEHDLDSLEKLDHPPNSLRMVYIAQELNRIYLRDYPGLVETPFLQLAAEAYSKAEKCLLNDQKGFSSDSHVKQMGDPRFKAHLDCLRAHWQKIGPEVERFKLGGTRPRRPVST
jgi:hypothetical protein